MLFATHAFIVARLSSATQLSSTQAFTQFCVKALAVLFFRLPRLSDALIASLCIDDAVARDIEAEADAARAGALDERPRLLSAAHPALFAWRAWHRALVGMKSDGEEKKMNDLGDDVNMLQ